MSKMTAKVFVDKAVDIAKNYKTVIKTADQLVDMGLMTMHLEAGRRLMKIYELTPKGKAIGKRMSECREIYYGNLDFEEGTASEKSEKKSKKRSKS